MNQPVDAFVESLVNVVLHDLVDDVRFEGRLPVVPVRQFEPFHDRLDAFDAVLPPDLGS